MTYTQIPNTMDEFRNILKDDYPIDRGDSTKMIALVEHLRKTEYISEIKRIEELIIDCAPLIPSFSDKEVSCLSCFIQFLTISNSGKVVLSSNAYKAKYKNVLEEWETPIDRIQSRAEIFLFLGMEDSFFTDDEIMREKEIRKHHKWKWFWIDVASRNGFLDTEEKLNFIKTLLTQEDGNIMSYRFPSWAEKFGIKRLKEIVKHLNVGVNELKTFLSRANSNIYPD